MALTSAQVDAAIEQVLRRGQSYTLPDGTQVNSANVDRLIELRRVLQAEEAAAAGGGKGMFVNVGFGRPQ